MKVYIKNKLVSLGGSSTVVDVQQNPVFQVKGRIISPTRKKILCDKDGNRLYSIRNRFINIFIHKAFIYDKDGNRVATVKDKWLNLHNEYFILGTQDEYKIEGKFFSLTSQILKNGVVAGIIRRQITFFVDAFELDAGESEMPFMIALVIALDNICDRKQR